MSERPNNYWEVSNVLTPASMRRRSKEEQMLEIKTTVEIEESLISQLFPKILLQESQE